MQRTKAQALDYYTYSTTSAFIEAHATHNFQGILLSKIPLVRQLKAREILGLNSLNTPQISYTELYLGLTNIFSFLRFDAGVASNSQTGKGTAFYRIGLSLNLN
ncbi:MAG: DUF5686 family protein [bacterium]|nr:DUF5686 family protein [bacterium]